MSSTLSQTDIANLALMKLGQRKVQSITIQTDPSAVAMLVAWPQAVAALSRSAQWNCLKKRANLGQLNPDLNPQVQPIPTGVPTTATPWVPGGNYAVNQFITYANYIYQCLIANTASSNFAADLSKGYWFQTDYYSPNFLPAGYCGQGTLYGWSYGYQLPADFVKLVELNGVSCWNHRTQGRVCEIFGTQLWTNASYADVKYIGQSQDTTVFDSLFVGCLVLLLASMTATDLRKDDETLSARLLQEYSAALAEARTQNGNEAMPPRYDIRSQSRFIRARRRSTNG